MFGIALTSSREERPRGEVAMIGIRNIGKYWARLPTQAEVQVIGHENYHRSVNMGGY